MKRRRIKRNTTCNTGQIKRLYIMPILNSRLPGNVNEMERKEGLQLGIQGKTKGSI
jgi:hypothetical protein